MSNNQSYLLFFSYGKSHTVSPIVKPISISKRTLNYMGPDIPITKSDADKLP